jgi:hypothetical protein
MVFKRLLSILSPIAIALGFELFFYVNLNVSVIVGLTIFLLLILLVSLKLLIAESLFSRNFWYLAVLPILLYLLTCDYILMLGFGALRYVIIILFAFVLYAYLENLFLFYYNRAAYQLNSLENIAVFYNIILFFILALDLNASGILLNPPLWLLSIVLVLVTAIMLSQLWWILKIKDKLKLLYLLVAVIIILEFFWALSFLPSNFYVLAIILTIIYYFIFVVFKAKMQGELDRKIFLRYALISGSLILITLITSHWI